jgi:hypothetical protein
VACRGRRLLPDRMGTDSDPRDVAVVGRKTWSDPTPRHIIRHISGRGVRVTPPQRQSRAVGTCPVGVWWGHGPWAHGALRMACRVGVGAVEQWPQWGQSHAVTQAVTCCGSVPCGSLGDTGPGSGGMVQGRVAVGSQGSPGLAYSVGRAYLHWQRVRGLLAQGQSVQSGKSVQHKVRGRCWHKVRGAARDSGPPTARGPRTGPEAGQRSAGQGLEGLAAGPLARFWQRARGRGRLADATLAAGQRAYCHKARGAASSDAPTLAIRCPSPALVSAPPTLYLSMLYQTAFARFL